MPKMSEGYCDSRPESSKPKPGKLDRTRAGMSVDPVPKGSEAFADMVGGKETMWKGYMDSRTSGHNSKKGY